MVWRILALLAAAGLLAADELDRGAPSILRAIFGIALLLLGPIVGGILLGLVQLGIYRLLVKLGWIKADGVPIFPVLLLRGMMVLIACIAAGLLWLKVSGRSLPTPIPG